MNRRTLSALAAASASLAVPGVAGAHVTVHPNVIPEGAFAVLNLRVPDETEDADTTKVSVELPPGVEHPSVAPPPGWEANVTETRIDFTGGSIPPHQFVEFPVSMAVPGKSGDTLMFKALQTYSDGEVVRWIGARDSDTPASTVTISDAGGLIEDSTGDHGGSGHEEASTEEAATPASTTVVREESSDGLAIAALIVGGPGLAVGGAALIRGRSAPS